MRKGCFASNNLKIWLGLHIEALFFSVENLGCGVKNLGCGMGECGKGGNEWMKVGKSDIFF